METQDLQEMILVVALSSAQQVEQDPERKTRIVAVKEEILDRILGIDARNKERATP